MQRRAVAVYAVFFLLLGASSYAVIAVAEKPPIEVDGQTYSEGDTFTVGGQQFTVASLGTSESGGGHGGGGAATSTGELRSGNQTISLSEGRNISLAGEEFVVHFPGSNTVLLSPQLAQYQEEVRAQAYYVNRIGGLWWVTMLSVFAAVLVVGLAYLPVRG